MSKTLYAAGGLALLAVAGWAGQSDYEHELLEQRAYAEKVCDGTWPDYKQLGETLDCNEIWAEDVI